MTCSIPLTIGGACILTSIIGTFFVKLGKDKNVMNALYKGFIVSAVTSLIILSYVTSNLGISVRQKWMFLPVLLYFSFLFMGIRQLNYTKVTKD